MPCLINLTAYITEMQEVPTNDYFVMNAISISKVSTGEEFIVHIVTFYPKDPNVKMSLQRIQVNQFVRVAGKFVYDDTDVDNINTKFLKVCILTISPRSILMFL